MKRRYSGFLLMLILMFALILGFIPGLETAMTVHAEEELEVSEELYATESVTASGTCGENLTWTLENGTLTISGTGEMENYESSTFWDDYNPTPWCSYAKSINSIIINDGVTSIGDDAFEEFCCLTTVSIPNSVTRIGRDAFWNCDSLMQIVVPDSVVTIGGGVFQGCDELLQVKLSNNITTIPNWAFSYCSNLYMVNIPEKCASIGENAFCGCSKIEKIELTNNITSIGYHAFYNCISLAEIKLSNKLERIGDDAFSACSSIKTITIPDTVKYIDEAAFFSCTNLSSITFEGDVPYIDKYAFYGCDSIKAVNVDSMESWLKGSFKNEGANPLYNGADLYIDGVVVDWTTLIIPDETEVLPAYAFCGSNCVTIKIPDSVTDIDKYCFYGCEKLKSIELPSNLVEIGVNAFDGCINLESVTLPTTLESICSEAFLNCEKLQSITIPASVTYIGSEVFNGCDNLKQIYFEGGAPSLVTHKPTGDHGPGSGEYVSWGGTFRGCTMIAYYPKSDSTWTNVVGNEGYEGEITWIGYESTLTTPSKPYKIANVVSGVHVYWNAVSGATKYGLWRSETGVGGSYKWMGNPTTNHFTDTKVESGKTYYYCVSTCNPKTNAHSIISEPLGITYVSTPDITNRMNLAAGVKLTWNKINGATGYAIYRKPYTGNAAWVRVTTISGNETFTWTDKSVASANGTVYRYTIRALAGTNMKTLSGCRNTGRTMARLTSRTMNSVTKTAATSVKCTWSTTAQASGYEVRFMNGSTVVKQFTVGNYKTGAKTFTGIPAGANYKVQVRSYKKVDGVGVFYSAWSTPKYINL